MVDHAIDALLYVMHSPRYDSEYIRRRFREHKEQNEMPNYNTDEMKRTMNREQFLAFIENDNEQKMQAATADFEPVTIYVPRAMWDAVQKRPERKFTVSEQYDLVALIEAEVPEFIDVYAGLTYEYLPVDNGRVNRYRVEQVGEGHVICRRMNKNRAGAKGSRLATTKEKIANDIRTGTAVVVKEDPLSL